MKLKNLLIALLLTFILPISVNAATAYVDVTSSASTVVTGNNVYVYVEVSSNEKLGTYEYDLSYNTKTLKLVSSPSNCTSNSCVWVTSNGTSKSSTYTFTFKAIGTGTSNVTVKNYRFLDYSENKLTPSISGKTIKTLTQEELEATYSKDNNLKSLSVSGYKISPTFSKDVTSYTLTVDSKVESIKISATKSDSYASVSGTGTKKVSEGENTFKIVVTAENGSKKTYTLKVTVKELNPIVVKVNEKEYTVVKKEKELKIPDNYKSSTITMDKETIPVFIGEVTKYTLVGLRDSEGSISLFIYDKDNETYTPYIEHSFSNTSLQLLDFDENVKIPDGYKLNKITLNNEEVNAYKDKVTSEFALVYALNLNTGNKGFYKLDLEENTAQRFNERDVNAIINGLTDEYQTLLFIIGGAFALFLVIVILSSIISAIKKQRKKKKKIELLRLAHEEEELRRKKHKKKEEKLEETKELGKTKNIEKKSKSKKKKEEITEDDSL